MLFYFFKFKKRPYYIIIYLFYEFCVNEVKSLSQWIKLSYII